MTCLHGMVVVVWYGMDGKHKLCEEKAGFSLLMASPDIFSAEKWG